MLRKRRLIAFICVIALMVAMLTPAASAAHYAVLVPLDPLFGLVVVSDIIAVDQNDPSTNPFLEVTGSRPPPHL